MMQFREKGCRYIVELYKQVKFIDVLFFIIDRFVNDEDCVVCGHCISHHL